METAYNYYGRNSRDKEVKGVIFAESPEIAKKQLESMGINVLSYPTLNLWATLQGIGQDGFDKRSLLRFYATMGRGIERGRNVSTVLSESAGYITDVRLKQAVSLVSFAVVNGQALSKAMQGAGFVERDASLIEAATRSSRLPDAFKNLHEELDTEVQLARKIKSSLRTPIFALGLMYVMTYCAMIFIIPIMSEKLRNTGGRKLPLWVETVYDVSGWINANLWLATALYVSAGIGLVVFFRSDLFKRLLDKIRIINSISVKKDLAQTWNSYALLLQAGIPSYTIAEMVSKAAGRPENRERFKNVGNRMRSGAKLQNVVKDVGFPEFLCNEISAAVSSNDVPRGIQDMVNGFKQDVNLMMEILQERVKVWSTIVVALFILLFVFLTYMPMFVSILSHM